MYPSHDELIQLARLLAKDLGYEGDVNAINGLCYGSCGPVMDHILTDIHKVVEFNTQLQWIKELIDDRHILENIGLLSEKEKIKFLEFFGKILPNQKPYAFIRSKKLGRIPYTQELAETMPLMTQSDALKNLGGLNKVTAFSGFYNLDTDTDIFYYLTSLKKAVEELPSAVDIPFSLLILNGIHAVLLGYNSSNNQYPLAFFDIAQGAIHKLNFQNMDALLPLLKNGLLSSDNDSKNYAIVTGLYCSANKKREALKLSKAFQSNLASWGLTEITLEKINQKAALDYTYLHLAARLGDIDAVQYIINLSTVQIDLLSDNGWSPLMYASQSGHTKIVELLLQSGAKIDLQQQDGRSALTYAIQDGHVETVALFIQYGADINLCSHSDLSPIMIAAKNKQAKIVELLIENGAYSFALWDIFICPIDGADIIMALIKENSATLDQYLSPILKSHDPENMLLTNILNALFQISNETQTYRQIDDFEIVFRRKFSIFMKKDALTSEDKKCLIKLYILLCTHDEMRYNNGIMSGFILFFKQEYTYKKKIEIAQDLLIAVENRSPIPAEILALQDRSIKGVVERCFPKEKECTAIISSSCI